MGLHPDVKKYLKSRFPNAVNSKVPTEKCEVQVVDCMWLLFKFHPEEESTGEDLVDFFWNPIRRFFEAEGLVYVCVFDAPGHVPIAKAEEHKRRYGGKLIEPLETDLCDNHTLPKPWHAGLANRKARAAMCAHVADGLARRFAETHLRFPDRTLYISGVTDAVLRVDKSGTAGCVEHAAAAKIGEGDLAVSYWVQAFHERATVVRVLDSDQVPILQLRAAIGRRHAALYIWLVTPKRDQDLLYHGYDQMPFEGHTLIDVLKLNNEVAVAGLRVEEFCFHVICQKTDFVDKVIANLGVQPSLEALEKNPCNSITITASGATCDANLVKRTFQRAAVGTKRKRAQLRPDSDVEFRRAWWTLCYWAFAWKGALPEGLTPRLAFGFDDKGARTAAASGEAYPTLYANTCQPEQ